MAMTRAVEIPQPGGPEVLRVGEREVRDPGAGEVRVAVQAAAVNPTDLGLRQRGAEGLDPPWVPGMDAAGVDRVGRARGGATRRGRPRHGGRHAPAAGRRRAGGAGGRAGGVGRAGAGGPDARGGSDAPDERPDGDAGTRTARPRAGRNACGDRGRRPAGVVCDPAREASRTACARRREARGRGARAGLRRG